MAEKSDFAAVQTDLGSLRADEAGAPVVSAIIPCLNEERTLGICIRKALDVFAKRGIRGEVVVGDNGSSDRSVEIAEALGARVVHQPVKGYGAAISAAAEFARGKYLIMADADDLATTGANSALHRRVGGWCRPGHGQSLCGRYRARRHASAAPLSRQSGAFDRLPAGFTTLRYTISIAACGVSPAMHSSRIGARSPGMEFASEMVINAHRAGLDIREVPIKLYPDKRDRPPHLRSFRDGWRHLRLIVAHAPDTMYLYRE